MIMIKNKIVALSFALLMASGSVRPTESVTEVAKQATEVSVFRKNLSKVFHVAALASIMPSILFVQDLSVQIHANTGAKTLSDMSKKDQSKVIFAFAVPVMLQIVSDFLVKNTVSDSLCNSAKILAGESAVYLFIRAPKTSVSKKLAEWAKDFAKFGNTK